MHDRVMKEVKKNPNCKKVIQAFELLMEKLTKFKND